MPCSHQEPFSLDSFFSFTVYALMQDSSQGRLCLNVQVISKGCPMKTSLKATLNFWVSHVNAFHVLLKMFLSFLLRCTAALFTVPSDRLEERRNPKGKLDFQLRSQMESVIK